MNQTRLTAWLRRVPADTAELVAALQVPDGEAIIFRWPLHVESGKKGARTRVSETDLAREILEVIQADCDEQQIICRYEVRAESVEGKRLAGTTCLQRPKSEGDPSEVKADSSNQGMVAHVLRHQEAFLRMMLGGLANLQAQYHELIRAQGDQIRDLRQREKAATEIILQNREPDPDEIQRAESMQRLTEIAATELIPRAGSFLDAWLARNPPRPPDGGQAP